MSSQYPRPMSPAEHEQPKRRTFRAFLTSVRSTLTASVPLWATILVMIVLGATTVVFSRQANQSAVAQDATAALLHQQQLAAAYVPTLAECKAYSPNADGAASVKISVASADSHLCESSMMLSTNMLPSDEVSITSPGGLAFVGYGETATDGSYVSNITVAMDATQANVRTVEQQYGPTFTPWEITVFYLPSIAPKGADASFGTRALAAYAADHPVGDLRSADARLGLPGVFQSTEEALYQGAKG